jgi:MSHA pilin protein MshC
LEVWDLLLERGLQEGFGSPRMPRVGRSWGFTIVELVAVLLIASILAFNAIPRFATTSTYDEVLARDQLLSLARATQQASFSKANAALEISRSGAATVLNKTIASVPEIARTIPDIEATITVDTTPSDGIQSCGSTAGLPVNIQFNGLGEVSGAVGGANYPGGVQFCINGENSVCIASSGYAHRGSCE